MGYKRNLVVGIKSIIKKILSKKSRESSVDKKNINTITNRDFTLFENEVIKKTSNYTMTSPERIIALIRAVDYIVENKIKGAIVECGVWKGGSIMAAICTLQKTNSIKELYLYDTFEGMTEPTNDDLSFDGNLAKDNYKDKDCVWCYSSLEEVQSNIISLNYPKENIKYIKGKVEDTIPKDEVPTNISLLRLDTDWYESTMHEMKHLFPRLVKGGIIIIDDYGHWEGCKKAVDEYLDKNNIKLFLSRVDYTCRIGVKI